MKIKSSTYNELEQQLEKAINAGNTKLADEIVAMLYTDEEQINTEMPTDFPDSIMAHSEKRSMNNMNKRKATKKIIASVASFALILSFGITAYASDWFQKPISIFADRNIVSTGENINEGNVDTALEADRTKDYSDAVETLYDDFASGCEGAGLPNVYPDYLTNHDEFKLINKTTVFINDKLNTKSVSASYSGNKKQLQIQFNYDESSDDIIGAYSDNMQVENQRSYTTAQGNIFTIYDVRYVDTENATFDPNNKIVKTQISVNNYFYDVSTDNFTDEEIHEILESLDLSLLK
ncbi:MAG: hypothetical protein RR233_01935 [Clostridiales bacterium]